LPLPFLLPKNNFPLAVAFSIAHIFHFYFAVALPVFLGKAIFGRRFPWAKQKSFAIALFWAKQRAKKTPLLCFSNP